MNWGYRIAFLYLGFAALITTMIIMAFQQRVDLVASDYYEQELKYQDRIDAIDRAGALKEPLTWDLDDGILKMHFPKTFDKQKITGEVIFFCPADERKDHTVAIPTTTSAECTIPIKSLKKGAYKMQVFWNQDTTEYYTEGFIQIH